MAMNRSFKIPPDGNFGVKKPMPKALSLRPYPAETGDLLLKSATNRPIVLLISVSTPACADKVRHVPFPDYPL